MAEANRLGKSLAGVHTTPVTAKPESRPHLKGARYKYPTSCSRHACITHTYQFPSSLWASPLGCHMVSALRSRSRLDLCLQ